MSKEAKRFCWIGAIVVALAIVIVSAIVVTQSACSTKAGNAASPVATIGDNKEIVPTVAVGKYSLEKCQVRPTLLGGATLDVTIKGPDEVQAVLVRPDKRPSDKRIMSRYDMTAERAPKLGCSFGLTMEERKAPLEGTWLLIVSVPGTDKILFQKEILVGSEIIARIAKK